MGEIVLCVNAGSSSLKLALYAVAVDGEQLLASAQASAIGQPTSAFDIEVGNRRDRRASAIGDQAAALTQLLAALADAGAPMATAIGHRFVHGGIKHVAPERVVDGLLDELRMLIPLAPNHLPS